MGNWDESKRAELEAEHGPIVVISHPDGSCFGFRRMTRKEYNLRRDRLERAQPDHDADERLLQERACWPSREEWNAYAAAASFEVESYIFAYHALHECSTQYAS